MTEQKQRAAPLNVHWVDFAWATSLARMVSRSGPSSGGVSGGGGGGGCSPPPGGGLGGGHGARPPG
eukprot:7139948-Pyramimonas_sp.AAC.1